MHPKVQFILSKLKYRDYFLIKRSLGYSWMHAVAWYCFYSLPLLSFHKRVDKSAFAYIVFVCRSIRSKAKELKLDVIESNAHFCIIQKVDWYFYLCVYLSHNCKLRCLLKLFYFLPSFKVIKMSEINQVKYI